MSVSSLESINEQYDPVIISSFGSESLSENISAHSGVPICNVILSHFGNGETRFEIQTNVRNRHIIIVSQMRTGNVNNDFMALTMILDACNRSDAIKLTVVIPYFPYSRSDKRDKPRVPIGAANIARILNLYNIDNIISLDLHAGQLQGLFNKGFHNLYIKNTMIEELNKIIGENRNDYVLVSPDAGSIKRIEAYSEKLKMDYIILHKIRDYNNPGTIKKSLLVGDKEQYYGKTGIIIDDMVDSMGTMFSATNVLIENGIKDVIIAVTHPIFSGNSIDNLENNNGIKNVIVTNSLPLPRKSHKIKVIDCSLLITKAIVCITNGDSISKLFE